MSTKIYNGYLLPKMDMIKLLNFCKSTQKSLQKSKNKILAKTMAELCCEKLDDAILKQNPKPNSVLSLVSREIMDRVHNIKKTQSRDPEVDFESSACFFPMSNKTLVLFFSDKKEITSTWEKTAKVKDYHYQNQTDRPNKVSAKDWKQREKDWNKVLLNKVPAVPSQNSFSFVFTDDNTFLNKEEVIKYLPSFETRCHKWAKNSLFNQALKGVDEKEFWNTFYKINDHLRTEVGLKEIKEKEEEIKKLLPQTYTLEDLTK